MNDEEEHEEEDEEEDEDEHERWRGTWRGTWTMNDEEEDEDEDEDERDDKLLQFQFKNKWFNETHKTIFKSVQIELISFGIIYLFIVLFCLQFLCFYFHFSLFRNWLFFLFSMI